MSDKLNPTPRKRFNPLLDTLPVRQPHVATAADGTPMEATAAIYNEKVGECPKCKKAMTTGIIANGDTVFFCPHDRVSTPLQD